MFEIDGDIELLTKRAMSLQANIFENELTLINKEQSVVIREKSWKSALYLITTMREDWLLRDFDLSCHGQRN